jgi:bacterial leucyl aminopeptidase
MKNKLQVIFFFLACLLIDWSGTLPVQKQAVTPEDLRQWILWLSSDEMRGRANGSPEMKTAALWISGKFSEFGVKPLKEWNNYVQNYQIVYRQRSLDERNVVGIIEGNDPLLRNEYIVLSAHFDHIGIRKGSGADSIYNGADDNAAGTCTLIGIAKAIKTLNLKPGRSIILAAFSGEEFGIRGSRYFVANAPIPLKNIYADINFEMTGHSELLGKNNYYMTGCINSNLDDLISEFNKGTGYRLVDTIPEANQLFYQSDNIAFSHLSTGNGITTGIPSGTFATSTMADYLHTVSDEADLFDFENYASLVNYFAGMVIWLSENKTEIKWTNKSFSKPE